MLLLIFIVNHYGYMCLVFSYIFSFNDYSMGNMIMRKWDVFNDYTLLESQFIWWIWH